MAENIVKQIKLPGSTTTYDVHDSRISESIATTDSGKLLQVNSSGDIEPSSITTTTITNKVDKVSGKGLSTNDYTTTEKNKLAGIAAGAEVNVQSDWNITDSSSDAFIKNKPTIPAAQVQTDWNATSGISSIANKPTLATVATSGSYNDLSNKPTIPAAPGTLKTDNTTAQTASSSEALSGTINLHKVSKTGSYSDLLNKPTIPTVNNGTLTMQVNGTQKATFTANQSGASTFNVTAADLGLTNSMVFVGTSTTDPKSSSGATVSGHTTWKKGEVVLYNKKEFVLAGDTNEAANWTELGDEGSFALKSVTITGDGVLEGGGTLEANRTITHKTSGATAGSYGDSGNQTPAYGGTFKVPYVTVNNTGHVTGISAHTVKIPASDNTNQTVKGNGTAFGANDVVDIVPGNNVSVTADTTNKKITISATNTDTNQTIKGNGTAFGTNDAVDIVAGSNVTVTADTTNKKITISATDTNTDEKVKSAASTTNVDEPILLNNGTAGTTNTVLFKSGATINPSTGNLKITQINGVAVGSSPKFTDTNQTVKGNGTSFGATAAIDIVPGSNVSIAADTTNNKITITATDTKYESKTAASGGTAVSLVTTGEKYTWNNKQNALPSGNNDTYLHKNATTGNLEWSTVQGGASLTTDDYLSSAEMEEILGSDIIWDGSFE